MEVCILHTLIYRATHVTSIAHQENARKLSQRIREAMQSVQPVRRRVGQGIEPGTWNRQPVGGRVHFLRRQAQISRTDVLAGEELQLLKTDDLVRNVDLSVVMACDGVCCLENL